MHCVVYKDKIFYWHLFDRVPNGRQNYYIFGAVLIWESTNAISDDEGNCYKNEKKKNRHCHHNNILNTMPCCPRDGYG